MFRRHPSRSALVRAPVTGPMMARTNPLVTFFHSPVQWLQPVQLSAATLLRLSTRVETLKGVLLTLKQLSPDDYLEFMVGYLEAGLERFGEAWGYTDLLTILRAATDALKPEAYLEIGVRRGRSLGVVAAACPTVTIYGFDLWLSNYAGIENPGPDFVQREMHRIGHQGALTLVSGDSKVTVPQFLENHPHLFFDIVTVDGDHSADGAAADLRLVLPRLKIGGVIVLDDVAHPQHRDLAEVWNREVASQVSFDGLMYTTLGYGVAFAVKRGSDAT